MIVVYPLIYTRVILVNQKLAALVEELRSTVFPEIEIHAVTLVPSTNSLSSHPIPASFPIRRIRNASHPRHGRGQDAR